MPSVAEILDGLASITKDWWPLAVLWHGYFAGLGLGLLFGVRPARRSMGILAAVPLLSVSALAWVASNPFNGAVLAISGSVLIAIAFNLRSGKVVLASPALIALARILHQGSRKLAKRSGD